jgi:hypothetical protein
MLSWRAESESFGGAIKQKSLDLDHAFTLGLHTDEKLNPLTSV